MKNRNFELLQEIVCKIDKEDTDILAGIAVGIIAKYFSASQKQGEKSQKNSLFQTNEELENELYALINEK